MLASPVQDFAMLDTISGFVVLWLHSMPLKPCLDITIWVHHHDASCFVHTFPLCRFVRWHAYHACLCHSLAFYASLHACLHVHAWVLLASVSSMLQHNEVMDIRSKPTFVPRGHHLLFAFLLVCLLSCLLACLFAFLLSCFFVYLVACHVSCHMLCLPCLSCLSTLCLFRMLCASFSFHCLFAGFLSLPFHEHTWSEGTWS